jgi:hypothetical protein
VNASFPDVLGTDISGATVLTADCSPPELAGLDAVGGMDAECPPHAASITDSANAEAMVREEPLI